MIKKCLKNEKQIYKTGASVQLLVLWLFGVRVFDYLLGIWMVFEKGVQIR